VYSFCCCCLNRYLKTEVQTLISQKESEYIIKQDALLLLQLIAYLAKVIMIIARQTVANNMRQEIDSLVTTTLHQMTSDISLWNQSVCTQTILTVISEENVKKQND
jgi:hypothetical protein